MLGLKFSWEKYSLWLWLWKYQWVSIRIHLRYLGCASIKQSSQRWEDFKPTKSWA